MALHRLSPRTVKTARPGILCDGAGLYLHVSLNPKTGDFAVPRDDEIIQATLVCENGAVVARKR